MLPVVIAVAVAIALAAVLAWRHFSTPAGVVFELDDARLLAAKHKANATLPDFWAAFDAAAPGDSDFMLKFDLNHGDGGPDRESIWADEISRADGIIRGRLANPPRHPDFNRGDAVTIDPAAIDDWAFFRNGVAHGHHVTRLMIELSPPRVAAQGRKAPGW